MSEFNQAWEDIELHEYEPLYCLVDLGNKMFLLNKPEVGIGKSPPPPPPRVNHNIPKYVLEFLNNLWGLGIEQEEGCRSGPPGYTDWWNLFLGIDSWAP